MAGEVQHLTKALRGIFLLFAAEMLLLANSGNAHVDEHAIERAGGAQEVATRPEERLKHPEEGLELVVHVCRPLGAVFLPLGRSKRKCGTGEGIGRLGRPTRGLGRLGRGDCEAAMRGYAVPP